MEPCWRKWVTGSEPASHLLSASCPAKMCLEAVLAAQAGHPGAAFCHGFSSGMDFIPSDYKLESLPFPKWLLVKRHRQRQARGGCAV